MKQILIVLAGLPMLGSVARCAEVEVADIKATYRHGQTFVTWQDVAQGEEGAKYRYSLYRSEQPITQDNLSKAELCYHGVLNNSAKLFGLAFNAKDRLDPAKPTFILEEGGKPLPMWSGMAVSTVRKDGEAYFAIVATDEKYAPLSKVVSGKSATVAAVKERVAPIQPIKYMDSRQREGPYVAQTSIGGKKGMSLHFAPHGSDATGGKPNEYGDWYIYFGTPAMGYRDGMPGAFFVQEAPGENKSKHLVLRSRDALEHPGGARAMETLWIGYGCVPFEASHKEPRVYPFTENRVRWMLDWVIKKYECDTQRVYSAGQSMGGMCSTQFAFRHPEIFAAVHPVAHRTRQFGLGQLDRPDLDRVFGKERRPKIMMEDGKTVYYDFTDSVKFAAEHHDDLPFYGGAYGRQDRTERWQSHLDMCKALAHAHHGFSFAWNDGNHGGAGPAMTRLRKYYPPERFARNLSYPAFAHSSIDSDPGKDVEGVPSGGELEGGINLGFIWKDPAETQMKWSVQVSNDLAKAEMTVDITPRRCQKFKLKAGETLKWSTSSGGAGNALADKFGLVSIEKVKIVPGKDTVVTIER